MGNLKKSTKVDNANRSKSELRKEDKTAKKKDNSLRLTEISDEELRQLRIDVYPYLM